MTSGDKGGEKFVLCRRVDRRLSVREHKACPYCFGGVADVDSGQHESFCDYDKGSDPIVFGFPTFGRHAKR